MACSTEEDFCLDHSSKEARNYNNIFIPYPLCKKQKQETEKSAIEKKRGVFYHDLF